MKMDDGSSGEVVYRSSRRMLIVLSFVLNTVWTRV
jgi:hypothetical protein